MRKLYINVIVFFSLFLFFDFLIGNLFPINRHNFFRTSHFYYHHDLLPNTKAIASWGGVKYRMYTNSLGFRDSCRQSIPLKGTKYRVLIIGDSHSEGVGVPFAKTFMGQLPQFIDTSKIEVLNASAVSYSPKLYYLKTKYLIEQVGLQVNEIIVMIDQSDLQNELAYQPYQPKPNTLYTIQSYRFGRFLRKNSFTYQAISKLVQAHETSKFMARSKVFDSYRGKKEADALDLYANFFSEFKNNILLSNPAFHGVSEWIYNPEFKELADKGLELGQANLDSLSQLCRARNIKLTLSVHPWQPQIAVRDTFDYYVKSWYHFAQQKQLGFINLYPDFIEPPVSAVFGINPFIKNDNHWNSFGHMLVARKLGMHMMNTK